ncbi:GGDEF domain-containing protein [Xanthobacter sp. TB0139]|uniref:GGDEF domain-containing protein n=1 Tax=Xanthobacter sp. TB0139 TaxID=3459178 RepID=UPI00403A2749
MDSSYHLDAYTLFTVNAVSLFVFAVVYIFAWVGQNNRIYWANLAISNVLLSIAFIMFSWLIDTRNPNLLFPNCLLVIGLSFRWQAVRAFFGHAPSFTFSALLTFLVFILLYFEKHIGASIVFGGVNIAISAQIVVIIYTLASERQERLSSRWGLVAAYGIILVSSILRTAQGWLLEQGMSSLLPGDGFLHIHLFSAAIHIVASGAFSLSMAYERGAIALRRVALHDALTGLPNRQGLEQKLQANFSDGFRNCAIFIIDIDKFKSINDMYGHVIGDHAIRQCGQIIARNLREQDFAARIGGEEFLIIIAHISVEQAAQRAEHMRQAIENEHIQVGEAEVHFTVSVGIAYTDTSHVPFSELMAQADRQLYKAKEAGRNRVHATVCA